MTLRIISDTHGKNNRFASYYYYKKAEEEGRTYLKILDDAHQNGVKHTLQIGDLGWRENLSIMAGLSPDYHKTLRGNHDDQDNILSHDIGDYGIMTHGDVTFGYVRGEYSIDKERRLQKDEIARFGKTWWEQEELPYSEMLKALEFFSGRDIKLFISHGAPDFLIEHLVPVIRYAPSRTSKLLTAIYEEVNIENWIFGHYHKNIDLPSDKGTKFKCLNELAYIDVDYNYNFSQTF